MRIVADTSVWVDLLRGRGGEHVVKLRDYLRSLPTSVLIGDVIALELLQGFREAGLLRQATLVVDELTGVEMVGFERASIAAERYRELRTRGITVRKTIDVVIASYCIDEGISLLYIDRDFDPFVEHFGLQRA